MIGTLFLLLSIGLIHHAACQEQQIAPVMYAVEGKEVVLPCALPGNADMLLWKFHKNGTNYDKDAAQVYVGNMPSIFNPFNSPSDRSRIDRGNFIIKAIRHSEEGEYWCEITSRNVPTSKSRKYPVHVYVSPKQPELTALANNTLTEYKKSAVARCTSQGGKPASKLTWMNGTKQMPGPLAVVKVNAFGNHLNDTDLDLVIESPTRFDHKRVFSCIIDHPSYESQKILNYSVFVMYHPINIRVWANLTSKMVYCKADGYPTPTYHWTMPGDLTGFTGPSLFVPDLKSLPGGGRFECTAENGIRPNVTTRVLVDNLLYPNGKPGLAGLEWWVWGAIAGGVLIVIVIIIVVCCIKCRKTDKGKATVAYKSTLKTTESETRHPTTLPLSRGYRDAREDSFDSRTPSPVNEHKQALVTGGYADQPHDVTLVPNNELRRSVEHLYDGDRRASREQLDQVADHIETMSRNWDQLSKSRLALNGAQDELHHMNSNLNKSREQLYHSREALNHDDQNYPYIDADARQPEYYGQQDYNSQNRQRQPPPAYDYDSYRHDSHGHGNYSDGPQYDARYDDTDRGYRDYDQGHDYNQGDYRYDDQQEGAYYGNESHRRMI